MRILIACLIILALFGGAFGNRKIQKLNKNVDNYVIADPNLLETPAKRSISQELSVANIKRDDHSNDKLTVTENRLWFVDFLFVDEEYSFGILSNRSVFKSKDSMMTWQLVSSFDPLAKIFAMSVSPADLNMVYFMGANYSYYTLDYKKDSYTMVESNAKGIRNFQPHPTQKGWMLGRTSSAPTDLYLTKDFGKQWTLIRQKVHSWDWCHAGTSKFPEGRLCMIVDIETNSESGGGTNRFAISEDFGATTNVIIAQRAYYFWVHTDFYFVIANDPEGEQRTLYVSGNNGTQFHRALLPDGLNVANLVPNQVLDDRTGAIWIAVNHDEATWGEAHSGNVYVSDADGFRFTVALHHVANLNNWWDLAAIESLEGAYLANVLESFQSNSADVPIELKTKITFNNGRDWVNLVPPTVDSKNNAIQCPGCSLNLFGITTWLNIGGEGNYGNFYSAPEAVGLILGTGNVGMNLQTSPEDVNTYLSRNGGETWVEVTKGSTIYEYGDHGGILVMAANEVPTTTLYYSLNEGAEWIPFQFTQTPVTIRNIFTTSTTGQKVVVFARRSGQVVYFGIDFSQIQERPCDEATDYEKWTPTFLKSECVHGHVTTYLRRKSTAECYNAKELNHVFSQRNCNCTDLDYECDFGYERTQYSNLCKKVSEGDESYSCTEGGTFIISSGYRKVPGDTCMNDIEKYKPTIKPCRYVNPTSDPAPPVSGGKSGGLSTIVVLVIVACVILAVAFAVLLGVIIGSKSERVRAVLPWVKKPAWFNVGYSPMTSDDLESELDKSPEPTKLDEI